MKALMKLRIGTIVTLVSGAFVLHGCSDDATGPTDIDPAPTADAVTSVVASLEDNEALGSLNAVGDLFAVALGSPAIVAPAEDDGTLALSQALQTLTLQAAAVMRSDRSAHLFAVIPEGLRGTTFVYDSFEGRYVASERTGAPSDGVRFILYAINPATGDPILDTEIGWVDLIDLSDASGNRFRIRVVSEDVTLIDYEVSCSVTETSVSVGGSGFITDGTTQVDLDLSLSLVSPDGENLELAFDFDLSVPSEDLTISFEASGETLTTIDATFSITSGSNTIAFTVTFGANSIDGQVTINGGVVAVISGTPNAPTVTDAEGNELDAETRENLGILFVGANEAIDHLIGLLAPGFAVCF